MESHEHPAQPQEPNGGFAEGQETEPTTPAEEQEPDFARGERVGPEADVEVHPGFDEGQEEDPADPEHQHEGRFDEGQA